MLNRFYACLLFLLAATAFAAAPRDEIESLLAYVGNLEGAVFIRNGSEHTPKEAAAHLRMKWEKQADKIRTAEDFITLCAAKSSISGQSYQIRFAEGTTRDSAEVLMRRLADIRRTPGNRSNPLHEDPHRTQ
jgi:hypothetical protein